MKKFKCQPVRVGRIYFISQHKHKRIGKAIHEYGWENFTYGILKDNIPENSLDECERFYITRYDCVYPKGYNCTDGGRNPPSHRGKPKSEETRKKTSAKLSGRKNPEHSARMKGRTSPNKGKTLSESTKKKISESKRRKNLIKKMLEILNKTIDRSAEFHQE